MAVPIARALVVFLSVALWPLSAEAEQSKVSRDDAWTFVDAWAVFRNDLDAWLPGGRGQVLLVEHLEGEPPWLARDGVRLSAASAVIAIMCRRIVQSGHRAALPALRHALKRAPDRESQLALETALVQLGDAEFVQAMVDRLRSSSAAERWEAAEILSAAGSGASPALEAALGDPDLRTRFAAASALASKGHGRAGSLLERFLKSAHSFERSEAAHALAMAGSARGIPVLRKELLRARGDRRRRVAVSLGRVGGLQDAKLLRDALSSLPRHRHLATRRDLLEALGRIVVRRSFSKEVGSRMKAEGPADGELFAAWFQEIGRAVVYHDGAGSAASLAKGLSDSLAKTLWRETPVAKQLRRSRVQPLVEHLEGRPQSVLATPSQSLAKAGMARLREALSTRGGEARSRLLRFDASVRLLKLIGSRLGHGPLSDPPNEDVRPVGLGASRAVDGNLMTSWVAGPMASELRLDFAEPRRLSKLRVIGGCLASRRDYAHHARVKSLAIEVGDSKTVVGRLVDGYPHYQTIDLPPTKTADLTLRVTDVYPGKQKKAPPCIAELRID